MCRKSPAVCYYSNKLKTRPKSQILEELKEAPLSAEDMEFMRLIIERASYDEMAVHFGKSKARIAQWKRALFERLLKYDLAQES